MMKKSICIVTNELYPITKGGCGTLIYNSIYELLRNNFRVILLAEIPPKKINKFKTIYSVKLANIANLKIYTVSEILQSTHRTSRSNLGNQALHQSYRFYTALKKLMDIEKIDIIEFPEYFGWSYHSLAYFKSYPQLRRPIIIVRFHLSMELIDSVSTENFGLHRLILYLQEQSGLIRADHVFMASEDTGEWVNKWYRKDMDYQVSAPALSGLDIKPRKLSKNHQTKILFYARLAPQKGADLFVNAAIKLIERGVDDEIEIIVAGPDMHEAPGGGSWIKYLKRIIPPGMQDRFKFPGNLDRKAWAQLLPDVMFAVMPSKMETYCYGARELAAAGVPTIVSNIPAFNDLIKEGYCLGCELESDDIYKKMQLLVENQDIRTTYSTPWSPVETLCSAYENLDHPKALNRIEKDANLVNKASLSVTVIILIVDADNGKELNRTIKSILPSTNITILLAERHPDGEYLVMGKLCKLKVYPDLRPIEDPIDEIACIAFSGDVFPDGYFEWAREILTQQADVGFIGCGTKMLSGVPSIADAFPWDAAPGALPVAQPGQLYRCLIRGPKKVFQERFNPQYGFLQEVSGIWDAIGKNQHGIRNPDMEIETTHDIASWTEIDSESLNTNLHLLLSNNLHNESKLQLLKVLKAMIHEPIIPPPDLVKLISSGKTPEIGSMRLNSKSLLMLIWCRIRNLFP